MILHIATDEKFIDYAIELFDSAAPDANLYMVGLESLANSPSFVKKTGRVEFFVRNTENLLRLAANCRQYTAVVIHGLDNFAVSLVNLAPVDTKFLWLAWGFDIYNAYPHLCSGLLQPETKSICRQLADSESTLTVILGKAKCALLRCGIHYSKALRNRRSAVRRISYCATILPNEWQVVRGLGFRGEFVRFNYSWIEALLPNKQGGAEPLGRNILIGNSSTPACNHVEILRRVSRLNLSDRKVVVPLSYGDSTYRAQVIKRGRALLGSAFVPLEDYMSINDYASILKTCGTVLMNHHRQQAMGNIVASIAMGARVFLNESNPVFNFFQSLGVKVFSLQADFGDIEMNVNPLTAEAVEANRECILREYGKQTGIERARAIVVRLSGSAS